MSCFSLSLSRLRSELKLTSEVSSTKNLAFGITHSVTYGTHFSLNRSLLLAVSPFGDPEAQAETLFSHSDAPYGLARRFSTLDHLTKGRVGFNLVSTYTSQTLQLLLWSSRSPSLRLPRRSPPTSTRQLETLALSSRLNMMSVTSELTR